MDTDAAAAGAAAADADADAAAAAGSGGGGGTWALDEAAVCLHFARGLLEAQPDWELREFEQAWASAVPEVRCVCSAVLSCCGRLLLDAWWRGSSLGEHLWLILSSATSPLQQGLLPRLEMLRGEALQHGGGTNAAGMPLPHRLKHFPLTRLPADAPTRFAALFAEKQR